MKNFGTLFGYELKKIWTRPMTWAAVLVFCAAFVWITVQPFFRSGGATFTATDANGSEISRFLTAGEQYRLRVEGARKLSGQPMDEALVKELAGCGLDAIECFYPRYTDRQAALYRRLAQRFGLYYTGGSDFHGERIKPEIQLKAVALELPWLPAQEEI